jgi:hypothetical protein
MVSKQQMEDVLSKTKHCMQSMSLYNMLHAMQDETTKDEQADAIKELDKELNNLHNYLCIIMR